MISTNASWLVPITPMYNFILKYLITFSAHIEINMVKSFHKHNPYFFNVFTSSLLTALHVNLRRHWTLVFEIWMFVLQLFLCFFFNVGLCALWLPQHIVTLISIKPFYSLCNVNGGNSESSFKFPISLLSSVYQVVLWEGCVCFPTASLSLSSSLSSLHAVVCVGKSPLDCASLLPCFFSPDVSLSGWVKAWYNWKKKKHFSYLLHFPPQKYFKSILFLEFYFLKIILFWSNNAVYQHQKAAWQN